LGDRNVEADIRRHSIVAAFDHPLRTFSRVSKSRNYQREPTGFQGA
jgi:hypothetical protein